MFNYALSPQEAQKAVLRNHGHDYPVTLATRNIATRTFAITWQIIRAILFIRKYDSLQDTLSQNSLNTVFELLILDVFPEVFNQLRSNGTTNFSKLVVESKQQNTR